MRIAAGIILIILGALNVPGLIIILRELVTIFSFVPVYAVTNILLGIVQAPFFITGGIFCIRRKYWRVCLASGSFAVFIGIFGLVGSLLSRYYIESWSVLFTARVLVLLLGAVISIIFISRKRKEWTEISDSVDCEVSKGG